MILLVALAGLIVGTLLYTLIMREVEERPVASSRTRQGWIPLVGALGRRDWLALIVEILCAVIAVVLVQRYGLTARSLIRYGAALVLIHTGAVDFKIRMIDTLYMVGATIIVLALAPFHGVPWIRSAQGLGTAAAMFLFFFLLAKFMFRGIDAPFGLGDVYLAAFIGALVGFFALTTALFYGILMAGIVAFVILVVRRTGRPTPTYISYGTYLCLGTLLYLAIGTR